MTALAALAAAKPKSFTLWQLPEQTHSQMMSYVIRTTGGEVIVIDGGTAGDAPYLRKFLAGLGNKVDAWFFTHPHSDHVDAPMAILRDPQGLKIGRIYGSMPDVDWIRQYEPPEAHTTAELNTVMQETGRTIIELPLGANLIFDGVHFDVLAIKNSDIHGNCINNSSVVLRVWDTGKSVVFLGDLGPEAGHKLVSGPYAHELKSDYCQMAHHGSIGCPRGCLHSHSPGLLSVDYAEVAVGE